MEFVAAVVAIIALIVAMQARKRAVMLERWARTLEQRLALPPAAAPEQPVAPIDTFEQPRAAPSAPVAPAAPFAPRPEAARDAAAEEIFQDAAAPTGATPPSGPAAPRKSFEERFGASWVVWIGGIALALGGIFLVQFSIEAGLIGPAVRIALGALLAAALIGAGEWMRRGDKAADFAGLPNAHIPSILTAAGTTIAYAVVYAAYALYGFLDAPFAFVLLGLVALATLAASLLHGPWLAALGQVGAFLAPLLVATNQPNYWALYLYLAIVTGASYALALVRLWRWLAITAIVFATLWMFPGIGELSVDSLGPHALHAVVGFALAAALIVCGLFYGPDSEPGRIDGISSGALAAYLFCATMLVIAREHDPIALAAFTALAVATIAIAWRTDAAAAAIPLAGLFATLVISSWAVEIDWQRLVAPAGATASAIPDPSGVLYGTHLALGFAYAALFAGAGLLAQGRSERAEAPILWAATAVGVPLAILVALYYRIYGFERALPFAAIALLLAALFAVATELLMRRAPRPGTPSAAAIFATGAIAALALALTLALEKGWLTVALSLMVPGTAYVAEKRPLPWLRWLCGALVVMVMLRIGYHPRIVGGDVGTTPVFNWLLYGYGVPALSFWLAGWLLRRRADDVPARLTDAAAILFTVLTAFLQIRHYVNNGNVFHASAGLTEVALHVCVTLAIAIGLERLRVRTGSIVHDVGAMVLAAFSLAGIVLGLGIVENPWFTGADVGGLFWNLILLGYALPAILAGTLGLITRPTRPEVYRAVAAIAAVALALAYLSLEVARFYHGPVLTAGRITNPEQYTYSAAWLAFGVVLLIVGIALRSQPVRLCSAAVVLITVAKVFLVDMADLTGVWRALSFIGLGLVLVGIGYLYQRLLFSRRPPDATAA
jgi:uncharacterized membrane protein